MKTVKEMKKEYMQIKEELKKARENTRYFNFDFYKTFSDAYEESHKNSMPMYESVFKTDFYNKNSCCYCEFLSIFYGCTQL